MKKKLLILMMVLATAITTLLMLPSKSASAYTLGTDQNEYMIVDYDEVSNNLNLSLEGSAEYEALTYKVCLEIYF